MRGISRFRRHRVVVHTRDDRSIRGVFTASYRDCIVLAHPAYLHEARETEVKGDAVIPKSNVAWLQVEGE